MNEERLPGDEDLDIDITLSLNDILFILAISSAAYIAIFLIFS